MHSHNPVVRLKRTQKRAFSMVAISALILITVAVLGYFSLYHDNTSEILSRAHAAMLSGDSEKAKLLYRHVLSIDPASEDACVNMALLLEKDGNFKDSAYFWSVATNLNRTQTSYVHNFLKALEISKADEILVSKYQDMPKFADTPDEYIFCAGMAFARMSMSNRAWEVHEELNLRKSAFAPLLKACIELLGNNPLSAKIHIREIFAKTDNPRIAQHALKSLCIAAYALDADYKTLKELLSKADFKDEMLAGDFLILSSRLKLYEGDDAGALKDMLAAAKLHAGNPVVIVEAAELAAVLGNADKVKKLKEGLVIRNKSMLMLLNYFQALEDGARGNWKDVVKPLETAGIFRARPIAQRLGFKAALETGNREIALSYAQMMHPEVLDNQTRLQISKDLENILKSYSDTKKLREIPSEILRFNPDNLYANSIQAQIYLESGQFDKCKVCAQKVLDKKFDEKAFAQLCHSQENLREFGLLLRTASERLESVPTDVNALIFTARAYRGLGKDAEAKNAYMAVLKISDYDSSIAEESGLFFSKKGFSKEFDELVKKLNTNSESSKMLVPILLSRRAREQNNYPEAIAYMDKAIAALPENDALIMELSELQFLDNNRNAAVKTMEKIADKTFDEGVRYQYAVLLLSAGGEENVQKALKTALELSHGNPKNADYWVILSEAYAKKGGEEHNALLSAKSACEAAPDYVPAMYTYAKRLFERRQFDEASRILGNALMDKPDKACEELLKRAVFEDAKSQNDPHHRRNLLERALKLDKNNEEAKKLLEEVNAEILKSESTSV